MAVADDWTAQVIEVFVLPGLAGARDARASSRGTGRGRPDGFLANALYNHVNAAVGMGLAPRLSAMDPGGGLRSGRRGSVLSAAAWADSAPDAFANVVLVPSLLVWLAGVATSAEPAALRPALTSEPSKFLLQARQLSFGSPRD